VIGDSKLLSKNEHTVNVNNCRDHANSEYLSHVGVDRKGAEFIIIIIIIIIIITATKFTHSLTYKHTSRHSSLCISTDDGRH